MASEMADAIFMRIISAGSRNFLCIAQIACFPIGVPRSHVTGWGLPLEKRRSEAGLWPRALRAYRHSRLVWRYLKANRKRSSRLALLIKCNADPSPRQA